MKIRNLFFLPLICVYGFCAAQTPGDLLNRWSSKSPIEKVYLHFDRDIYFAGETAWFKAYMYSDFLPGTSSTSLYTELLNPAGKLVAKKVFPILYGSAQGQFELKDSLPSGQYFIRAFSATMLNQSQDFLFQRSIYVSGAKKVVRKDAELSHPIVRFYPESGNFVDGLPNTMAFKITGSAQLSSKINGVVKDENGNSITTFSTYHDGMGMFDITPDKNKKYYVQLDNDNFSEKYYLPAASPEGIVFRLILIGANKDFELLQQTNDPSLRAAYMIGQMQHHVFLRKDFAADKNEISGNIDTRNIPSGVLQLTVFNKDGLPLAERLCFVDNKEYIQPISLILDTVSFEKKSKNHFTLQFPDSVSGNFSVAITNSDFSIDKYRENSIVSNLLLTSDLKGHINDPLYYFSANEDSAKAALDLLMMINGWRRFKWTELSSLVEKPLAYKDSGYISIAGSMKIRDTKKPVPDRELFVKILPMEDSLQGALDFTSTDNLGNFKMDSLIFYGKTKFFINDIQGKKSKWLDVYPATAGIRTDFGLPTFDTTGYISSRSFSELLDEFGNIAKDNIKVLSNVTVKTRKKSALEALEDKYTRGLFSGMSEKTIDLVNTNEKIYQGNIFDYIQGRVASIRVSRNGFDYTVNYRNTRSLMGGPIPMILYLDEMQVSANFIAAIPVDQVAMIKVFSNFVGAEGGAAGGVLAIYTKKGSDVGNSSSNPGGTFIYDGYSITKEFYSPDYGDDPAAISKPDTRPTIYWQPNIFVAGTNEKVPVVFYNDDRCKSFKVIVEGITADGKLVFFEKTINSTARSF